MPIYFIEPVGKGLLDDSPHTLTDKSLRKVLFVGTQKECTDELDRRRAHNEWLIEINERRVIV